MNTTLYCLYAYKPSSADYCRGCHMASYTSEFISEENITEEALLEQLVKIYKYNHDLESGEDGYENIRILVGECDGEYDFDEPSTHPKYRLMNADIFSTSYYYLEPELKELYNKMDAILVAEQEAKAEKARLAQIEFERQVAKNREAKELAEFERLSKKFAGK